MNCYRCNCWPCTCADGQTIVHGDCRDVLPELPKVDLVLTDPPYGGQHRSHGQIFLDSKPICGDDNLALIEWTDEWAQAQCCSLASFFSPYHPPRIKWRSILIWDKGAHVGGGGDKATCWKRDAELIGVKNNRPLNGKRDSSVIRINALLPPPSGHFCEKPVALMKYLVGKFQELVILDPFLGSGTTLVACKQLGRRGIGIEIEERYAAIAARRLEQEMLPFCELPTVAESEENRVLF